MADEITLHIDLFLGSMGCQIFRSITNQSGKVYKKFCHKNTMLANVENFVSFYVALCAPNVFVLLKLPLRSYLETSCATQTSFLF
jgi:hypothetical protein